MLTPFKIHPPENHQDFEYLCLKVWGEIWSIQDDIEFNSTNSQGQDGVDICGVPLNGKKYFGIQCKNKGLHFLKNGKKNTLEKKVILEEVERAKLFKPNLGKLIIATSHDKDKELQEFVRKLNIKHIESGLFSIQICFWDYISRQIQEKEQVYNWYVKNECAVNRKVKITFENDKEEIIFYPEFIKTKTIYRPETPEEKLERQQNTTDAYKSINEYIISQNWFLRTINKIFKITEYKPNTKNFITKELTLVVLDEKGNPVNSYPKKKLNFKEQQSKNFLGKFMEPSKEPCSFRLKISNVGNTVIENYELHFSIDGECNNLDVYIGGVFAKLQKDFKNDTFLNGNLGKILPNKDFLVQKEVFTSKKIYFYPNKNEIKYIYINWKLISRDYNDEGVLSIRVIPTYIENEEVMFVENENQSKVEYNIHEKMIEVIPMIDF